MDTSLSEAELKVMDVVWNERSATARHIAEVLADRYTYSLSATYTLITRCIKKGALERVEPGYVCQPLVSRKEIQDSETDSLIERVFQGSADDLFVSLIDRDMVSPAAIASAASSVEGRA